MGSKTLNIVSIGSCPASNDETILLVMPPSLKLEDINLEYSVEVLFGIV